MPINFVPNPEITAKIGRMKRSSESQEDFLEALLVLEEEGLPLETTRVAKMLGVSKPAIHQMGHELIDRGLITRIDYGDMKLTEAGREIAIRVYNRHKVLKQFLLSLGISEETAEEDCCRIEHVISDETFDAIEESMKK